MAHQILERQIRIPAVGSISARTGGSGVLGELGGTAPPAEVSDAIMVIGDIDITSYPNPAGVVLRADEFGLSEFYSVELSQKEGTVPRHPVVEGAITGILGATATVSFYDLATPTEVANAVDIGVCQYIVTGRQSVAIV